jgi:hypothetical protein
MRNRFLIIAALLLGLASLNPVAAQNGRTSKSAKSAKPATRQTPPARQAAPAAASDSGPVTFFTTYQYTAYTIFDKSNGEEPIQAEGVSGTLTLRPDGSFAKRMQLSSPQGPMNFNQDGTFTISGDNISFSYTDSKGQARTDTGTFRLNSKPQRLVITLEGYPAGNRGVYTLLAQDAGIQVR